MKLACKLLGGLSLLLLMAGGLLSLTGWMMGGRIPSAADSGPLDYGDLASVPAPWGGSQAKDWTTGGSEHLEPFREVRIDLDLGSVAFEPAGDYGVSLAWTPDAAGYQLHYTLDGGVLRIWSTGNWGPQTVLGQPGAEVTVYLPEGAGLTAAELDLDLGGASLYGFSAESLTVDADLGAVSMCEVQAGSASLTLDMGDLTLTGCQFGSADLALSAGSLTAQDLTVTGTLEAESDMGAIDLDGVLGTRTDLTASLGDVALHVNLPVQACGYDLEVDMGSITVDGKNFRHSANQAGGTHHIRVEADMGDVELTFA